MELDIPEVDKESFFAYLRRTHAVRIRHIYKVWKSNKVIDEEKAAEAFKKNAKYFCQCPKGFQRSFRYNVCYRCGKKKTL